MLKKIRKKFVLRLKKALPNRLRGAQVTFARENKKDKNIDLFNHSQEYVTTVSPTVLGVDFRSLTEQNEEGVGRPKIVTCIIKPNKSRFTFRQASEDIWHFLPYLGIAQMRDFLLNIEALDDQTETVSKLIRGEPVSIRVPENRIPYIKDVYSKGSTANPYIKESRDDLGYLVEKYQHSWRL